MKTIASNILIVLKLIVKYLQSSVSFGAILVLKGTAKALALDLLRLNTPRGAKNRCF